MRRELPPGPTDLGAAGRPTQLPMPWRPLWFTWRAPGTPGQPHPSQRVAARTGAHRHWQVHPAAYSGQRRTEQSAEQAAAPAPGAPPAHAPGGHADPGGRQPSPVVGGTGAAVHAADRRGRCHRHGGRRPLLPAGGRPQLLPADPEPASWAMALLRAGRCSRSRSGRVSDSMAAELTAAWRRCSRFSRVGRQGRRLSSCAAGSPAPLGKARNWLAWSAW